MYDIAPCGHVSTALDGTIVAVNQTLLDWTGFTRIELQSSRRFQTLLTVPGNIFYENQFAPLLQLQGSTKAIAFELVCKDSKILPVLINAIQRGSSTLGAPLIHIAIFDATYRRQYEQNLLTNSKILEQEAIRRAADLEKEVADRREVEENLRQLTARLLKLRDDEQRRLARALHDSVGQLLAALSMNQGEILREKEKLSERSQVAITENVEITGQILSEIRTISQLLHPPLLDEVGLGSALRWYVEGLNKRSNMTFSLDIQEEFGRLPGEIETATFRIVQECLTNAHRHASADRADVSLSRSSTLVSINISDNGRGMPEAKIEQIKCGATSGVGLRGMRERIHQLAGTLEISSGDQGTTIQVTLPIPLS